MIARAAFVSEVLADQRATDLFRQLAADLSEVLIDVIDGERLIDLPSFAHVADTVDALTTRLGLPWPWLVLDLADCFWGHVRDLAIGQDRPTAIAAPFTPTMKAGRMPKGEGGHVRRYVSWFYRAHVQRQPEAIAALVREYVSERAGVGVIVSPDQHAVVRRGIAEARRLLELPIACYPRVVSR